MELRTRTIDMQCSVQAQNLRPSSCMKSMSHSRCRRPIIACDSFNERVCLSLIYHGLMCMRLEVLSLFSNELPRSPVALNYMYTVCKVHTHMCTLV